MRPFIAALCVGLGLSVAQAARAYDLALIIGNEEYERLPEFDAGDNVNPLDRRLRSAGFEVILAVNADLDEMLGAVDRFVERAPGADRLLVVLNGRFLKSARDWYLLPVDARETIPFAQLPRRTLDTSVLMSVLSEKSDERAVMVMGTDPLSGDVGPYLQRGLVDLSGAYDFVLIGGAAEVAGTFAEEVLATPGESFDVQSVRGRNLAIEGLDEPPMTFIPSGRGLRDVPEERPEPDGAARADLDYWNVIRTFDTEQAYVNYLDRFPDGAYATEAAERLDAIRDDPDRQAREGEDDLNLGRDERRRVQTSLAALDFDPGAIDGIFGAGTRAALESWQQNNGFARTGYLTADQLSLLSQQAGRRVAELEAEAERLDRTYWAQTGADGSENGLRAYLERYPRGLYAAEARDRLDAFGAQAQQSAALADAEAWDDARAEDTTRAYRRYLNRNPDGAFVDAARARLGDLRGPARDERQVAAAQGTEEALNLNPVTRGLIEGRLEEGGYAPGTVDGRFDEATREAIRRFQQGRGLPPTGYLDQAAVVQLLAESILR